MSTSEHPDRRALLQERFPGLRVAPPPPPPDHRPLTKHHRASLARSWAREVTTDVAGRDLDELPPYLQRQLLDTIQDLLDLR